MKLSKAEIQELIGRYQSELRKLTYQSESIKSTIQELETHIADEGSATKAAPKRRGRTAKAKTATTTRRRGRPAKPKAEKKPAAPKRRGRPAKAKAEKKPAAPKRRGRPPKAKAEKKPATPKRRGRPAKAKADAPATAPKKRRGRPPKAKTTTPSTPKRRGRPPRAKTTTPSAPKRRGRPPKAKSAAKTTAAKASKGKAAKPKARGYRLSEWDNLVVETLKSKGKVLVFADFLAEAQAKQGSGAKALSEQDLYRRINQSLHKLANKRGAIIKVSHSGRGYAYGLPEWKSGRGVKKQYR